MKRRNFAFWKQMMDRHKTEESYNREIIRDFAQSDGIDFIVHAMPARPKFLET